MRRITQRCWALFVCQIGSLVRVGGLLVLSGFAREFGGGKRMRGGARYVLFPSSDKKKLLVL